VDSEDLLAYSILESARLVHGTLGPGFVESIYGRGLMVELKGKGFQVERERVIKIWYAACCVGKHRLDLIVNQTAIIELKANRSIIPVHVAQVLSYLYATDYPFGLVLNFGTIELQWEIVRPDRNRGVGR
jgi:GxxExxY protein